jgi:hypothetical protein
MTRPPAAAHLGRIPCGETGKPQRHIFREGRRMVTAVIHDDLFTREVTDDPYTYFGRLLEEDPVHWNELYELWVITCHDDLVWLTRHHELFSSEVLKRDPRPPYPQVSVTRDPNPHVAFGSWGTSLPWRDPGTAGGSGGLQSAGTALSHLACSNRGAGIPAQHDVPFAQISTSDLVGGRR